MKKVIIGAGPAGLYTAIKFRKKGIFDLVVYDPRAGNYTRPGHLNANVFERAQEGLKKEFWPEDKDGHIKDLEKALYEEAKNLGIKIEKKRFLRLHQDPKKPGVVVGTQTEQGITEEIIEADYVFDCTGTRREVINAVNTIDPKSPFQWIPIIDPPIRNHFLAYVKMSQSDWIRFNINKEMFDIDPDTIDALPFTRSMIQLHKLGWKEFTLPRCYGKDFGKDKICLYLHAPDELAKTDYDKWVQTVLDSYTNPRPIHYDHLTSSKPKPQFLAFPMNAGALKDVSYKGDKLPTVIALGDAQIDFDYYLAHGIKDGMGRIDTLFKHLGIVNKDIYYFDSEEYLRSVMNNLTNHKEALINEAKEVKESFVKALELAKIKLTKALNVTNKSDEQNTILEMLAEIKVRQIYEEAYQLFVDCHSESNHLLLTKTPLAILIERLNKIQINLTLAHSELPVAFNKERKEIEKLLSYLAVSWKELGNQFFKKKALGEAIDAYQKALEIHSLDYLGSDTIAKKIPIYSNLTIAYLQNKQYEEAISIANQALSLLQKITKDEERPVALQEKIVFNLIKALCVQAEILIILNRANSCAYHSSAIVILNTYKNILSSENLNFAKKMIDDLQNQLEVVENKDLNQAESLETNSTSALANLSIFNHHPPEAKKALNPPCYTFV